MTASASTTAGVSSTTTTGVSSIAVSILGASSATMGVSTTGSFFLGERAAPNLALRRRPSWEKEVSSVGALARDADGP